MSTLFKCKSLLFLSLAVLVFAGCKDDEEIPSDLVSTEINNLVLIANQGNFGWGEGTLTIYDKASKKVRNDVFSDVNREPLGNVFQSISEIDNQYYLVMNNSEKIIVTDTGFQKIDEITGLVSPRYFYQAAEHKAFVTDLYSDAISVIDLTSNLLVNEINIGGATEHGVVYRNQFWCVSEDTDSIYAIDIEKESISYAQYIGANPKDVLLSNNNQLVVLCRGDVSVSKRPSLAVLNLDSLDGLPQRIELPADSEPTHLVFSSEKNHYLFLDRGELKATVLSPSANVESVFDFNGGTMYALEVDPETGDVYAADAQDFVSRSKIYRLSSNYQLLDEFSAGIITGDFFFN